MDWAPLAFACLIQRPEREPNALPASAAGCLVQRNAHKPSAETCFTPEVIEAHESLDERQLHHVFRFIFVWQHASGDAIQVPAVSPHERRE